MKLILILTLLFTNLQPGTDSTKAEPKKKPVETPKPAAKKAKKAVPFIPFIIDYR